MNKLLKDCLTGKDNQTYDIGRVLWFLSVLVFLILSTWDCWLDHDFKPADYGTGLGLVLAAGGGALWLKRDTEPSNQGKENV